MNAMTMMRAGRQTAAAKVVGSLAIVSAAAAVAGLGAFGTFTDSTAPAPVAVQTGIVSIDLASAGGGAAVPLTFGGVAPGAAVTQGVDLVNNGDSALSSVKLATVATTSSLLDTDSTNGLQMTVESCPVAWTSSWTCAGGARTLLPAGPVVRSALLAAPLSLTPGSKDHLAVTLALPAAAGEAFKQQSSDLSLVFTGVQRDGEAR